MHMSSKIKIKVGPVEVEYEGSEEFLKNELAELLSSISKLYRESGASSQPPTPPAGNGIGSIGTTGAIAVKLQASSGSDLALAAAARLYLGHQKASFTRD